jgi:glycine dehydrogenase
MSSHNSFERRHIGPSENELANMLQVIGVETLDQLIDETVPSVIRASTPLNIPEALSENQYLIDLQKIASKNKVNKTYIGQGYYGTITPSVILRNVFQNPGWYTQYTPYQAEIAQGRLESLLNFQTMISDLTGLPIANASLLDEGTAAAEAMAMMEGIRNKKRKNTPATKFFVDHHVFKQTQDIMYTRASPLDIEIVIGDWSTIELTDEYIGVLIQYPDAIGSVNDYRAFTSKCKSMDILVSVATDLLSLCLLTPPGEWGADVVLGNSQRFGVPMGYGGPHAAFFATTDENKRLIPGRIIGMSVDVHGNPALRMALQTREQHIRREKATSNICTAQALLANMAAMYAVYHGQNGLREIAIRTHNFTCKLNGVLQSLGYTTLNDSFFDTITISLNTNEIESLRKIAEAHSVNFFYHANGASISLDETVTDSDFSDLVNIFSKHKSAEGKKDAFTASKLATANVRTAEFCTHPVFSTHHTESAMMRYIKRLENKDLSLTHSMISLGSCTMKLNAATEMIPVSWPEFANLHPFAPLDQTQGYQQIFEELAKYLCECTGFTACSLQPNSGAQGEYAGLLAIRAYHLAKGDTHRKTVLIPSSAHGTNPASAVMVGMEVVVVTCDEKGNIDVADLTSKIESHKENLAALMVTYPSTHGVFETAIKDICKAIHDNGGLVYMDGANMNAQVGLTSPGLIGADVCHLNLHKTFAIPHGGGGPGMGPICVNDKLAPFLPGHVYGKNPTTAVHAVSSAQWGSASILLISYAYIKLLGGKGLTNATKYAILNANYIMARLDKKYDVLYLGVNGRAAHELIIDLRPFKSLVSAEDVAKRLIDYGFHAPTLSFPVAGTIMIEPTESENQDELDRFCNAMLQIREEIDEIASGAMDAESNVITNSPHTANIVTADNWTYSYSREKAAYPLPYLREGYKFWPSVARIDSAYGDRNLVCTCAPIEDYVK